MVWTAEKIKLLKKLWLKGKSTIEIGRELGMSKNAVVGKVHRLELAARPSPIKKSQKQADGKQKQGKPVLKQTKISLMDLKLTSCRWPMGDPKDDDFHFCGADTVTGKPYCSEHCKIAYTSLKELTLQNAKAKREKEEQEIMKQEAKTDDVIEEDEAEEIAPAKKKSKTTSSKSSTSKKNEK